jgi:hypothetical protein
MALKSNQTKTEPLEVRIRRMQDEAEAFLDAKAIELKAESPEVPLQVLRNLITVRHNGCACNAALNAMEQ